MSSTPTPDAYITVDGASTRDMDDALHVARTLDGGYHVRVAIANPLPFVPMGGALDTQARNLAASVYMRDRPLHRMLPASVSEQRASLVADEARSAIVFEMMLNADLEVVSMTPQAQTIQVARRLTYDNIPQIVGNRQDPHHTHLREATELSVKLLAKRRRLGALALYDMSQLLLTDEEGNLRQHDNQADVMGNILVQEMMILTNSQLGNYLATQSIPALFRNHQRQISAPDSSELANLIQNWMQGQFDPNVVQAQFSAVAGKAEYGHTIQGHYGLSLPVYVHATSPLRRYADLVNLRQLAAHLEGADLPYDNDALQHIAQDLNETIARQKEARSEGYKRALKRIVQQQVDRGTLSTLANHELTAAVKIAAQEGAMPQALQDELVRRADDDSLAFEVAQRLLFLFPADLRPAALNEALANWMHRAPHRAPSLISAGIVLGAVTGQPRVDTDGGAGAFESSVRLSLRDGDTAYEASAFGAQKKLSAQRAMTLALCAALGVERHFPAPAAKDETRQTANAGKTASSQNASDATYPPASNPKGQLMEFCQKHRYAPPVFAHSSSGPPHQPTFDVTVTLTVNGQTLEGSATGLASKKAAEAQASWALLERIHQTQSNRLAQPAAQEVRQGDKNPISSLQEWCQKHRAPLPEYEFRQVDGAITGFECSVLMQGAGGDEVFVAQAGSKQEAKVLAAQQVLDRIREAPTMRRQAVRPTVA